MDLREKPITIPLGKLIDEMMGGVTDAPVKIQCNDLALLLSALDDKEELYHIEFPNPENKWTSPGIWRIDAWRHSYKRACQNKETSILSRHVYVLRAEIKKRLAESMAHFMGEMDPDELNVQTHKLVYKNNWAAIEMFSVNCDELKSAVRALAAHEAKLKLKPEKDNGPSEILPTVENPIDWQPFTCEVKSNEQNI